jgi:carboxylate-amine ligase
VATFGIEEELLVVGLDSGDLVARGPDLIEEARDELGDLVVSELSRCQVETNTSVCSDLEEAEGQLRWLRGTLGAAGQRLGLRALAVGSHPWSARHDQTVTTDNAPYRAVLAEYQQVARETVMCGCHVHVGVDDPDERIRAMNGVAPWLPVLLALSANSPWWQGDDTGYASYRTLVWKAWPTATMPPPLPDYEAFEGLIKSMRAVEAVDDASAIYWYARPSSRLPTIEFRVADTCLRVEDAVTIAGLARALTATILAGRRGDHPWPPTALLDSALWRAARHGLTTTLVDPGSGTLRPAAEVIDGLLAYVEPALRDSGDHQRVTDGVRWILDEGTGAEVQRAVLSAGPASRAEAITAMVSPRTTH